MGVKTHVNWIIVSVSVLWTSVLLAAIVQDWQKWMIFRDVHTHKLIPVINPPTNNASRVQLLRMGPIPCSCESLICGCCVFMDIEYFDYHRNGCMNMTYYPNDFAVGANMLWNGESVWSQNVSGKNPPPVCMQMPIPYLPAMDMCVRMFDIYTPSGPEGYNIHMCMNWEFRTERAPLLVLEFDCFRMGQDGWANIKPGTPNAGLPVDMGMGSGGEGMPAAGEEAPQGAEGIVGEVEGVVEEVVGEAEEANDNKRNLTTTTRKPPKKVPPQPRPSTAAPFLSLEVEELSSSSLIVPNTTDKYSSNKETPEENNLEIKAPNLNLNIKEFEDLNTRLSVLNAPEKVVKIDFNLDTSNNTITEKAKHVQFAKNAHFPIVKDAIDLNRDLESLIEDPTEARTLGLDYDNSIPDSVRVSTQDRKLTRSKRDAKGRGKRIRERERPAKKKDKNPERIENKRRNKNRNRNKNREKHRNRNKLYAPTLSFNIVEMSQEYKSGKDKRPMMSGFHDDSRSTAGPMGPPKEIVLTYPEPRGQRSLREHSTTDDNSLCHAGSSQEAEENPLPIGRTRKVYKVVEEPEVREEPEEDPLPQRRTRKMRAPDQERRSPQEGRARNGNRALSPAKKGSRVPTQEPEVKSFPEGRPRKGRRAPELEVGLRRMRRSVDRGDSTAFPYRPVTERPETGPARAQRTHRDRRATDENRQSAEETQQSAEEDRKSANENRHSADENRQSAEEDQQSADETQQSPAENRLSADDDEQSADKDLRSADENRARKPGKKNRRTTAHPSFVAPALNLDILEVEPPYRPLYGYNDRYKLDQTLTSMTTPAPTTMSPTTTPMTTPMTLKVGPDIDININNLYIYLATFTTYMRNETLDEY